MFKDKTIKARVMEAVNSRIKAAEQKFTEKCDEIDRESFNKKEEVANQLVADILNGKEINA